MFDKTILPIHVLLYGSEIWGFENIDIIERVHLHFCKLILHLKQSTPNFMVYGELGRYPISVIMIRFWCRILNRKEFKLSYLLYKLMYINFVNYGYENKWLSFIQNILNSCGMSNIWLDQNSYSTDWLSSSVEQKLKDKFFQEWSENMNSTSKGLCYRIFKTELKIYIYFTI